MASYSIFCHLYSNLLILSWGRLTLIGSIGRHNGVTGFKRVAADIIVLDINTPKWAKKFINANMVQVLLCAYLLFKKRYKITSMNRISVDHSVFILISSKDVFVLCYYFKKICVFLLEYLFNI